MGDAAGPATGERRSERDLMRAAVVLGLVFFHTLRVFASGEDCVKHTPASTVVDIVIGLLVPWAMPLLFLISGIGTWYSLRFRGGGPFVVERLRRLLVPLVLGVVVLCPIPVWFEMNASPAYQESYWGFWQSLFRVSYEPEEFPFVVRPAAGSEFETGHLWFVILLLTFSLGLLPLFLWLRGERGRRVTECMGAWCDRHPTAVFLPAPGGWCWRRSWAWLPGPAAGSRLALPRWLRPPGGGRRRRVTATRRCSPSTCCPSRRHRGHRVLRAGVGPPGHRPVSADQRAGAGRNPAHLRPPGAAQRGDPVPVRGEGERGAEPRWGALVKPR